MKAIRILTRSIKDSFKSVFRNFSLSIASIACIIITLLVVSIAIILSFNVNNFTASVEKEMTIVVFLQREIKEEDIPDLSNKIKVIDYVDLNDFKFIDKMQIREDMMASSEDYKIVLQNATTRELNPLSDTFHVKVTDIKHLENVAKEIEKLDGVLNVKYGEGMVEQLVSVFDIVKNISYGVVIALILVTAFLIANTIKITIFSRKREIEIMRLVGASNTNIKIPFIFEGLFLGALGSIIPILITIFGYNYLYTRFSGQVISPFIQLIVPLPFTYFVSIVLLIIGVLVGMFGSYRAVRKYLKI